ncbi:MAG TPA: twin-arginine translocation signal domain-containing protein, partial [bacterium]|nr:twin-arginine translocation signal domain-containing protein [bacterium]
MKVNRRDFLKRTGHSTLSAATAGSLAGIIPAISSANENTQKRGSQRLSLKQLKNWEDLHYGMFIHFGMSTFVENELPDGRSPSSTYAPDSLDVDQWISVARDAGMKYAVLTTKHVAGHCLWPSKHTDYTVASSGNTTDVVEKFVKACDKRGIKPGFYYCSWDNHNRFGSKTPSDGGWNGMNSFPQTQVENLPPYTTSLYQNFQTAQIK